MSSTTSTLSPGLRATLNRLGERLYWSDEEYREAVETIRRRAEAHGFEHIETGQNRLVLKIPTDQLDNYDEPLVAKLPRQYGSPDGLKQNIEEIDLWENAPEWFREFLIPVRSAHPRGYWLVMQYAPEVEGNDEIEERQRELHAHNLRSNELGPQNWGRWHGDVYLIDYGLDIAHRFSDIEVRNWVDIFDEDHRTRHPEEYNEEGGENRDSENKDLSDEDHEPAVVVYASADVGPHRKSCLRSGLLGKSVESGETIEVELSEGTVLVEIEGTEPRSDRSSRDTKLLIDEDTRISL